MAWRRLPDLEQPITGESENGAPFTIYFPFEADATSELLLAPSELEVARRPDKSPDLVIEAVRGSSTDLYGVLSFSVAARYDTDTALDHARARHAQATLRPVPFEGGFLRLWTLGKLPDLSDPDSQAFKTPIQLTWNGMGQTRFRAVLPPAAIDLLMGALHGGRLEVSAYAEMEFRAVAPRLQARVEFEPGELLDWLADNAAAPSAPHRNGHGEDGPTVSRNALLRLFGQPLESLPLALDGDAVDGTSPRVRAETLTCWTLARFGTLVPAAEPNQEGDACYSLSTPSDLASTPWDLSRPVSTPVPVVLRLHPLLEAARVVAERGIEPFVRKTEVPRIDLGTLRVELSANLPPHTWRITAVDVDLRPVAIPRTITLDAPDFVGTAVVRFSPVDERRYSFRPTLVLDDGTVLSFDQEDPDAWTTATDSTSIIDIDRMPARFVLVEPDPALGAGAALRCLCTWKANGREHLQEERIGIGGSGDGGACFVLPLGAAEATLTIEASPPGGGQTLTLGPMEAASIRPGLYSFREFGRQSVTVRALFDGDNDELVEVDLRSESSESSESSDTLIFDPAHDIETWTWTASSPFAPGYVYRVRREGEPAEDAAPWSAVQSPFHDLTLDLRTKGKPE